MLKKNETIEILKNGGEIMLDSIYRRATVYNAEGENLGACRYDTAERIERAEGFTTRKTDWYATRFIVAEQPAQVEEIPAAVTADFGVRACVAEIEKMVERGNTAADIAANLAECFVEQGAFFNQKMWTAFDLVFPDFPVSHEMSIFYWNDCKHEPTLSRRRAECRSLIAGHAAQVEEERTQEAAQADAMVCEICGDEIPTGEDFRDDLGRCCCCHCFADRAAEQGINAAEITAPAQEQPEPARVAVRDPETEEILEGSPRAIYHAIVYRVRYARRYHEDSPAWEPLTENAARIIQAAHAVTRGRARAAVLARATVRGYRNQRTQEQTQAAAVAMGWHRSGDAVTVSRYLDAHATKYTTVHGARVEKPARDENRDYCRRVADEIDSYAAGDVARCPNCGEIHARPWDEVGDVFRCPHCGDVADVEDWETLTVWDYLADVLDYEYIVASTRELQAVRVYVTLGGPTCWIDTERRTVELRWGGESACYGLLSDTVDAVEEWARDMWEMGV